MSSPELEFEPGEWYLVVICKNCKARQPMIHDLSRGKFKIDASYNWYCPRCGHQDNYGPDEIERYKHETNSR